MAIYRDFIYLDLDRVQSIIAQLRKGLLTELLEGKERAVSAGGGAVLKFLFGVSAEAQGTFARTVERTSVMHDYAFEEALGALRDERLILENLDSLDRDELPVPDTAFILVRGSAKLVDYELTSNFAENWPKLNRLFTEGEPASEHSEPQHISRQQRRAAQRKGVPLPQSPPEDQSDDFTWVRVLVEGFRLQDAISISITSESGITFTGRLARKYIREELGDVIFKYGAQPTGEWVMLAQVGRIAEETEELAARASALDEVQVPSSVQSGTQLFDALSEMVSHVQAMVGSAAYPSVSVSPIAVFREAHPVT